MILFAVQQQQLNSRPGTPNSDTSSKLPSLAMERIKIHTNNARDRMEIMQKRYHEYKDSIQNGNSDSNRASLNASPFEVCYLTNYFIQILVTKTFTTIFFCANLFFVGLFVQIFCFTAN